uniref:SGNH hydrolase-type esterase domain-containing protein n=1 Tax=Fagus sylvatica TaxID=28930 RepID=A0A2N9HYQ9_FAGSY
MERVLKMWYVVCILLLTFVQSPVHGEQQVPCYFIFGDSLVDNGNNNGLATMAKANYPPYGIDFPNGPTGSFCNGRTMADFIGDLKSWTLRIVTPHNTKDPFAELLGFDDYIPSYATTRSQDILKGVNYASGAAGIRSESGQQMGARISMGEQLQNHLITITRIADIFRDKNLTGNYLSKYGTNGSSCVDFINNAVQLFNNRLKSLIDDLNNSLSGAKFIYVNFFGMASGDASSVGLTITNKLCCEVKSGMVTCVPLSIPCSNRTEYLFWDMLHPTEAFNFFIAGRAYNAQSQSDTYPIDIRHLAEL